MPSTLQLQFSPIYCTFMQEPPKELEVLLFEQLSFHPEGYFFSPKYQAFIQAQAIEKAIREEALQRGTELDERKIRVLYNPGRVWDGWVRLYHPITHRFRCGMLYRAMGIVNEYIATQDPDLVIQVTNLPVPQPFEQQPATIALWQELEQALRPYQIRAATDVACRRFGILQAPMRSGKTNICAAVIDSERRFPTNVFCRSLDLMYQTVTRLQTLLPNIAIGMVGDGLVQLGDVNVITIQSAFSAFDKPCPETDLPAEKDLKDKLQVRQVIHRAQLVFYDEVHHVQSSTSRFIMDRCKSADMRIGLSATPFADKDEDMLVEEAVGPVLHKVTFSELIREGFLLRPHIYMFRLPPMDVDGNYQAVYKEAVTDNEYLSGLLFKIVQSLLAGGHSIVVQTEYVKHSKQIAKLLSCPMLTGKDTTEYRLEVITGLRSGDLRCVVSTLFEEGLDVPRLSYTINLAGGLSNIGTLQRMRSITAAEGKTTCGIIDFFHQCKYLERHSEIRLDLYRSEPEFVVIERDVSEKTLEEVH